MTVCCSIYPSIQSSDIYSRNQIIKPNSDKIMRTAICASGREFQNQDFNGKRVDESMIVLRMRIHEMKMGENNYEPPREWMDCEKRIYTSYDSMICDAMGHLQSYMMETRPSLAIGMIALIALSVPISTAVVMSNLLELIRGVLA
ncbi:hypothetical protein OROGR_014810 [Orobanche gracilis]